MIIPDEIRVPQEKEALSLAIGITVIIFIFILGISIGFFVVPFIIIVLMIKQKQGSLLGNSVKITENQFPDIYKICKKAEKRLTMKMPDVFITQSPVLNAMALGFWGRKSVILHSALVETMTEDELSFIIGHEFTHIKCDHTNWTVFTSLKDSLNIPVISDILSLIFNSWSRKAEYTCDRGGLLVNQNTHSGISSLAKLSVGKELFSKLDLTVFKDQKEEVTDDDVAKLSELLQTHPHIVNRIQGILRFSTSKKYQRLLTQL